MNPSPSACVAKAIGYYEKLIIGEAFLKAKLNVVGWLVSIFRNTVLVVRLLYLELLTSLFVKLIDFTS